MSLVQLVEILYNTCICQSLNFEHFTSPYLKIYELQALDYLKKKKINHYYEQFCKIISFIHSSFFPQFIGKNLERLMVYKVDNNVNALQLLIRVIVFLFFLILKSQTNSSKLS